MVLSRDRRRPRRGAAAQASPAPETGGVADADPELDSYLAALSAEREADTGEATGGFAALQVLQLRLPADRVEQLRRMADEREVAPAELAAEWLVERLDTEDAPTGPLPRVGG